MTGTEPTVSSQVSLLFPHPRRSAVLVADAGSGLSTPTLPTLSLRGEEPALPEILACIDVVATATIPPVLRLVVTDEASLVVEFDGLADAPAGWRWLDLDPGVPAGLEPRAARTTVAAWARERAGGWSPLRPQWSRPGWFAAASAWMVEQMAAVGGPALDAPRIHQLWGVSVVLVAPSPAGNIFLKCSADAFRHEAFVTRSLAARTPKDVPEVTAVEAARGWMLMRDLGAAELGDQDQSLWDRGLVAHARIQQRWLDRTDELVALGLPVRSLADLAATVEGSSGDATLLGRLSDDVRDRWLAAVPSLVRACLRLDEIGPGPTLVHGDLHPWNVAHGPTTTRIFDWTDAAVSHPFVDLATYLSRTDDQAGRRRLVEAYVGAWSTVGPEHTLREAVDLAPVVGSLYQVQAYRTLLPTLMAGGADDGLAGLDLMWLERTLACHARGLEGLAWPPG